MLLDLVLGKVKIEFVKKILAICVIVLIASFLGYMVETFWVAFRHRYIDNRGMHLPFLLGYGLANLIIYLLFGLPNQSHNLIAADYLNESLSYFLTIFVFISFAEALFGHFVHYFCGVEWWNYNSIPLHIGQYTSVPTSIGFTFGICLFLEKVFSPLMTLLVSIDLMRYANIIVVITVLASIDCIYALLFMAKNKKTYTAFHLQVSIPSLSEIVHNEIE